MYRSLFSIIILIFFVTAPSAYAKRTGDLEATSGAYIDFTFAEQLGLPVDTVANITATPYAGAVHFVTDGLNGDDCSVGGGSYFNLCTYDGTQWNSQSESAALAEISKVLAGIDGTVVDVFIYNTYNDTDGGAWRKTVSNRSWYGETLNTSTRGATREFPAVALIVAETDTVTIYDATDPDIPMWMVFNANSDATRMIVGSASTLPLTSVSALNGVLVVSSSNGAAGGWLSVVDFIEEQNLLYYTGGERVYQQGVVERNYRDRDAFTLYSDRPIVSRDINDVAMTTGVVDKEFVTNGTFDYDIGDWVDASTGTGSIAWSRGAIKITGVDGSNRGKITQDLTGLVAGLEYKLTINHKENNANSQCSISNTGGFDVFPLPEGLLEYTFTPTSSTVTININVYGAGTNTYDDISITVPGRVDDLGLITPTIAVATDGGVSVIDGPAGVGTVVDSAAASAFSRILFDSNGFLKIALKNFPYVYVAEDYSTDSFSTAQWYDDASHPALLSGAGKPIVDGAAGGSGGLTLIKENPTTPSEGMVAYMDTEQPPMWQQGDIKGAFLASTTEETIGADVTTEYVDNGVISAGYLWEDGSASNWLYQNGQAEITVAPGASAYLYQPFVHNGLTYRVQYSLIGRTAGSVRPGVGGSAFGEWSGITDGIYSESIESAGANNFYMQAGSTFVGSVDDIWLWEAGAQTVTGYVNYPTLPFDTLIHNLNDISSAINLAGASGYFSTNKLGLNIGTVYEIEIDMTLNSGVMPTISTGNFADNSTGDLPPGTFLVSGINRITFKYTGGTPDNDYLWFESGSAGTDFSATVSVREITDVIENGEFSRDDGTWEDTSIGTGTATLDGVLTLVRGASSADVGQVRQEVIGTAGTKRIVQCHNDSTSTGDLRVYANGIVVMTLAAGEVASTVFESDGSDRIVLNSSVNGSTVVSTGIKLYEAELVNGTWQPVGNLLVNPSFEGWLDDTEWATFQGGELTTDESSLKLLNTDSGFSGAMWTTLQLTPGDTYELSVDLVEGASMLIRIGSGIAGTGTLDSGTQSGVGTKVFTFIADYATSYLTMYTNTIVDDLFIKINNISVKRVQNLVENGEFSSDRVWTKQTGWSISGGIASSDGSQPTSSYLLQPYPYVDGNKYLVKFDVSNYSAGGVCVASEGINPVTLYKTANGSYEYVIEATATSVNNLVIADADFVGSVDNVEIYELTEPDRSYNDNPLQVVGQLEKTAVNGGELVAYSGFSAEDYLAQPYNSDLNFGTGDFHEIFWNLVDTTTTSVQSVRRTATSNGFGAYISTDVYAYVVAPSLYTSSIVPSVGVWEQVAWVRKDGELSLYINGVLSYGPVAAAGGVDLTTEMRYGVNFDNEFPFLGKLGLCRVGAGAPSADQLKFMYDQEKHLFQSGAKCTLQGTSDSVSSIDYDPVTTNLYVADDTSTITEISGLNVINSIPFSSPITISAHGSKLLRGSSTTVTYGSPGYNIIEEFEEVR